MYRTRTSRFRPLVLGWILLVSFLAEMAALGRLAAAQETEGTAESWTSPVVEHPRPATCTYRPYAWSVEERRGVNHQTVEKPYAEVSADERDPNDPRCTVCVEDQAEIDPAALGLEGLEPILVCSVYRDAVDQALRVIAESGEFTIVELTGYRPGRTRGRVVDGVRTEWSNHSFGTAVDVNADYNGLYGDCRIDELTPESLQSCHLRVGGEWDPRARPDLTVVDDGVVHRAFSTLVGWRWGGEIEGDTRDMMHFSLTGY